MSQPSAGKTILVVTEGEKTEPDYLRGVRNHLKLHSVQIEIIKAENTDPLSVVNQAIEMRTNRKREAKHGCGVPYDEVWVVIDKERADMNPKLNDALQKAMANKIDVALSNPCFEYWLLLHDEFTTAPFESCDKVIRRIKDRYLPEFDKGNVIVDRYIPKIPNAVQNAEQCRKHHASAGTEGNPSTDVDFLMREMNSATRPHFRLDLDANAEKS